MSDMPMDEYTIEAYGTVVNPPEPDVPEDEDTDEDEDEEKGE